MTPQDQGAGTNPLNNLVTIMQQAAIHAGFANRMSFFYLDTFAKAIRAAFEPKEIDPTQGKADDIMEAAAILKLLADGEDVSDQRKDARRLAHSLAGVWKAQGKESDGPEASPLQKAAERVLKAYDRMELQGGGTAEILQAIDTKLRPALNAERSDAPTPNLNASTSPGANPAEFIGLTKSLILGTPKPPPNPLETAEQWIFSRGPYSKRLVTIPRDPTKPVQIVPEITLDQAKDVIFFIAEKVRVREVPGSTAGEGNK